MNKERQKHYRIDIDCLRAFAMAVVVLYHCHFAAFAGGFIGVDVFFVISGYVMFRSVSRETRFGLIETLNFYQKRLFRIYPAILMALVLTTVAGMVFMSAEAMDYFGKQLFFASLSISNLLFAQGENYFSSDTPALLHTWSLAVEMQFYVLFPFFVMALRGVSKFGETVQKAFVFLALVLTFAVAESMSGHSSSFFLLQARGFEFLMGVAAALFVSEALPGKKEKLAAVSIVQVLIFAGALIASAIFFKSGEHHPGYYSLMSTLPAMALMMMFARYEFDNRTGRSIAYLGRLSYGIYLYHFPITYFVSALVSKDPWVLLAANLLLTLPLAVVSYHLYETPLRRFGYRQTKTGLILAGIIILVALGLSGFGYVTAKQAGWPQRLRILNPFAYEVSQQHTESREYFTRGFNVLPGKHGRILFVGDSVLQQYIDPITRVLDISASEVDSVTRGGCLLLKGVNFEDVYADISCNGLRAALYNIEKTYDYVVISQQWPYYRETLLNAVPSADEKSYDYILPFLDKTLEDWSHKAQNVIVLGVHPVAQVRPLEAGPFLSPECYAKYRDSVSIETGAHIQANKRLIKEVVRKYDNVVALHPIDAFCSFEVAGAQCRVHDQQYSYFRDSDHVTRPGQGIAKNFFRDRLSVQN